MIDNKKALTPEEAYDLEQEHFKDTDEKYQAIEEAYEDAQAHIADVVNEDLSV